MQTHPRNIKQALKIIAVFCLVTVCFNWAWNTTIPVLFELSAISLRQALALLLLLSIPSFLLGHRRGLQQGDDELKSQA